MHIWIFRHLNMLYHKSVDNIIIDIKKKQII